MHIQRQPIPAIGPLAAAEFLLFAGGHRIDHVLRDPPPLDDKFIEDANAARGNGPHRQFFVSWCAELAHDKDVKGCVEGFGDLKSHRDTASRQTEDANGYIADAICGQPFRKKLTRFRSIPKSLHHLPPSSTTDRT
jgi:hypothetical protein